MLISVTRNGRTSLDEPFGVLLVPALRGSEWMLGEIADKASQEAYEGYFVGVRM